MCPPIWGHPTLSCLLKTLPWCLVTLQRLNVLGYFVEHPYTLMLWVLLIYAAQGLLPFCFYIMQSTRIVLCCILQYIFQPKQIYIGLRYNTLFYFPRARIDWNNKRLIQFFIQFLPEKNMCDHLIHKQDWYKLLDTACSLMKWDHPSTVYGLNQPLSYCK